MTIEFRIDKRRGVDRGSLPTRLYDTTDDYTEVNVGGHTLVWFKNQEMIPALLDWLRQATEEERLQFFHCLETEFRLSITHIS